VTKGVIKKVRGDGRKGEGVDLGAHNGRKTRGGWEKTLRRQRKKKGPKASWTHRSTKKGTVRLTRGTSRKIKRWGYREGPGKSKSSKEKPGG